MILLVCLPCMFAIRVMPNSVTSNTSVQELEQLVGTKSDYWPSRYVCPKCDKAARGMLEQEVDAQALRSMELRDLTPQEAFLVQCGMGLPEEQACSVEILTALLREQPIRKVLGTDIRGSQRALVDGFELWDGTVVYFGSAAEGAVVYRIRRPVSYTNKALLEASHG